MLNIFTVPAKVWTKCQVFLPCHISCTKSLGQSATCPRSFQLSRDQGSHPLITLPSQNKKARYSPQSHPDQRKLIKRVHVCLKSAKTTLNMENQVPTLTSIYQIVLTSFYHIFLKAFIFEVGGRCDKRCVVTTTKQDSVIRGTHNRRHLVPSLPPD